MGLAKVEFVAALNTKERQGKLPVSGRSTSGGFSSGAWGVKGGRESAIQVPGDDIEMSPFRLQSTEVHIDLGRSAATVGFIATFFLRPI